MHYIIDGYNLLFRKTDGENLQKLRQALIEELVDKASLLKIQITVVFDSKTEYELQKGYLGPLEVVYTKSGLSADDYILEELSHNADVKQCLVITSDKPLARQCRQQGAKTMTVDAFVASLKRQTHNRIKRPPPPKPLTPVPQDPPSKMPPSPYQPLFEKRYKKLVAKERALQEEKKEKRKMRKRKNGEKK